MRQWRYPIADFNEHYEMDREIQSKTPFVWSKDHTDS